MIIAMCPSCRAVYAVSPDTSPEAWDRHWFTCQRCHRDSLQRVGTGNLQGPLFLGIATNPLPSDLEVYTHLWRAQHGDYGVCWCCGGAMGSELTCPTCGWRIDMFLGDHAASCTKVLTSPG